MTLPNKLTLLRILIIPIMLILYYIPYFTDTIVFSDVTLLYILLAALFAIASITDFLDGHIARSRNLVTTFGKFADPLADKMLTFTAMAIFVADGYMPMWVLVIILIREFMVSGLRMVLADKQVVIAAAKMGKYKTAFTMVALIVMFFSASHTAVYITGQVLMYIALVLTIISGLEYLLKNRKEIFESM